MQLPTNSCKAIPADNDQTARCPYRAIAPSAFCQEHAEEHRAVKEQERTATREADRLKPIVDDIMAQDADAYARSREIRKDERVVGLYLESLEQQMDAAVALKTRFFSPKGESHAILAMGDLSRSNPRWPQKIAASMV